jgi:hypothetical protein
MIRTAKNTFFALKTFKLNHLNPAGDGVKAVSIHLPDVA